MVFDCHVHPKLIKDDIKSYEKEVKKLLDCMGRVGIDKANVIPLRRHAACLIKTGSMTHPDLLRYSLTIPII